VQCSQALQLRPTACVLPSLVTPGDRRNWAVSLCRCGGRDGYPLARAGDAFRLSRRDHSTRSIKERLTNSRELARDASSRDMAFPPAFPSDSPRIVRVSAARSPLTPRRCHTVIHRPPEAPPKARVLGSLKCSNSASGVRPMRGRCPRACAIQFDIPPPHSLCSRPVMAWRSPPSARWPVLGRIRRARAGQLWGVHSRPRCGTIACTYLDVPVLATRAGPIALVYGWKASRGPIGWSVVCW
jgi:hypothetical protein